MEESGDAVAGPPRPEEMRGTEAPPAQAGGAGGPPAPARTEEDPSGPHAVADRVAFLGGTSLWSSLPRATLESVAASMQATRYAEGETILRQGDQGSRLHVVTSGRVSVRLRAGRDGVVPLAELPPGACFGEMSLLTADAASADVVALEEAETLSLDRGAFHSLVDSNPGVLREFVAMVSRRLRSADAAFAAACEEGRGITEFLHGAGPPEPLVGKDRAIRALEERIRAEAARDEPLLLEGEKGVGKTLVARRIHALGPRASGPLLAADCARISQTQWGDQLFGDYHRRDGSPRPRAVCYMDLAEGGTLLLRNIQALPAPVMKRLGRYLERDGRGGSRRRNVRILATFRGTLGDVRSPGASLAALPSRLAANVLRIPPLRERKRDIPDLARHFLERHAARHLLEAPALDGQAVTRLVTHDFRHANLQELEEAVQRALALSSGHVITAEEIFLGAPAGESGGAVEILPAGGRLRALLLRLHPRWTRVLVAAVFAGILALCFAAPASEGGRLALLLVWALWWPALMVSFFLAGRAWCSVCPMAFAGGEAQALTKPSRRIPNWMKEREPWILAGGFFVILWLEEATGLRHSPVGTGILLLSILAGAVGAGLLFPRRTWCRHLCPLGGFAGACSTSSLLEIRPTPDICAARCVGHLCFKGTDEAPGCPMFQHVMFLDTNRSCLLCMNCLRTCPNGSPRLRLRAPGLELWSAPDPGSGTAIFMAVLSGLLAGVALVQSWERFPADPFSGWLEGARFPLVTVLLLLTTALPPALLRLAEGRAPGGAGGEAAGLLRRRMMTLLPLVGAGFTAFHLAYLPGLGALETRVGIPAAASAEGFWVASRVLPLVQLAILAAGIVLTLVAVVRVGRAVTAGPPGSGSGAGPRAWAAPLAGAALWSGALLAVLWGPPVLPALTPALALSFLAVSALSFRLFLGTPRP